MGSRDGGMVPLRRVRPHGEKRRAHNENERAEPKLTDGFQRPILPTLDIALTPRDEALNAGAVGMR
jgi:hypothetical protein